MNITVVGTGYVGLVTGVMLASLGHSVFCVGRNKEKIDSINRGISPFYEPGLDEILLTVTKKKKLIATADLAGSVQSSDVTIIAVGTPTVKDKIDLTEIKNVSRDIGQALAHHTRYHVVVVKSTVVPQTTEKVVAPIIQKYAKKKIGDIGLCMNPEFLREGKAIHDATHPDRIVIGQIDEKSGTAYGKAYAHVSCPIIYTNLSTAEMIKYVSNSLLSTLISYSNEIARICERIPGVDTVDIWKGLHLDGRLSPVIAGKRIEPGILSYIRSGCGYGGSCFPKDTKALLHFAKTLRVRTPILEGSIDINRTQPLRVVALLRQALGSLHKKRIAILGLTFKPDTDDIRESPSIVVIHELIKDGAQVVAHDPQAYLKGVPASLAGLPLSLVSKYQEAIRQADAVVIMTSWQEYKHISPEELKKLMKRPIMIDGRRIFDSYKFLKSNIVYKGIGFA